MINNKLVDKVKKGDIKTRNELIMHYQYIVQWVSNKLRYLPFDKDTIKYGATLGLMKAIKNYREDKGNFDRYAFICAKQCAKNELSKDWIVKPPQEILHMALRKGLLPYERVNIYKVKKTCHSGNNPYYVPKELMHFDTYKDRDIYEIINNSLNNLKPIEKDCILYKYGGNGHTLKTLGKQYGVTYERIRQIVPIAFKKLKTKVQQELKK
jgi:RNA polymerase sigma factor (sigma-70 family)